MSACCTAGPIFFGAGNGWPHNVLRYRCQSISQSMAAEELKKVSSSELRQIGELGT